MAPPESVSEPQPQPHLGGVQTAALAWPGAVPGLPGRDWRGAGAGGRLEEGAAATGAGVQSVPEPGEMRTRAKCCTGGKDKRR